MPSFKFILWSALIAAGTYVGIERYRTKAGR